MINSSTLLTSQSFLNLKTTTTATQSSSLFHFKLNPTTTKLKAFNIHHSIGHNNPTTNSTKTLLESLSHATLLAALAAFTFQKFSHVPPTCRAESSVLEENHQEQEKEGAPEMADNVDFSTEFVEANIDNLKALLQKKLQNGEDEEGLKILKRIVAAQPEVSEWKFLMARLLNEMGQTENARHLFEEILAANPLSFEALFENALLMDQRGEGEAVIRRLEEALAIAVDENKAKEARDIRLIMAQIQFLQKNVDEALKSYKELAKEDPGDFRPYFCQGMIYNLLDRNEEAKDMFAKYRDLSPRNFDVEGYLRTPLSKMKIFGADEDH